MKWISVEDRLPDKAGGYLCACLDRAEGITDLHVRSFWTMQHRKGPNVFGVEDYVTVTHWMPLPPTSDQDNDCS